MWGDALYEFLHDVCVGAAHGAVQWRPAVLVAGLHVSAAGEQQLHQGKPLGRDAEKQRRLAPHVTRVHVRSWRSTWFAVVSRLLHTMYSSEMQNLWFIFVNVCGVHLWPLLLPRRSNLIARQYKQDNPLRTILVYLGNR